MDASHVTFVYRYSEQQKTKHVFPHCHHIAFVIVCHSTLRICHNVGPSIRNRFAFFFLRSYHMMRVDLVYLLTIFLDLRRVSITVYGNCTEHSEATPTFALLVVQACSTTYVCQLTDHCV